MLRTVKDVVSAVRSTQLAETTGLMSTPLVHAIEPSDTTQTVRARISALFKEHYQLSFYCTVCCQEGQPYELKQTKGWVRKVGQGLEMALCVLEIAGMVAGLPIPRLSRLVSAVVHSDVPFSSVDADRLEETRRTLSSLEEVFKQLEKGVKAGMEDSVPIMQLADCGPSGRPAFTPTITHAQALVVKALFAVLNDPTASRCGLMRVQCVSKGRWAWVCSGALSRQRQGGGAAGLAGSASDADISDCARLFQEHGEDCLWIRPKFV